MFKRFSLCLLFIITTIFITQPVLAQASGPIYIVQSGDTLSKIALQYGVTIEALATRNDIDDPRRLRTGVKLIIPIKRR